VELIVKGVSIYFTIC